jgi:hypothetical protein
MAYKGTETDVLYGVAIRPRGEATNVKKYKTKTKNIYLEYFVVA